MSMKDRQPGGKFTKAGVSFLKRLVFDVDPGAKLLVLAGRGHAAEVPPADGWTPMASVLKQLIEGLVGSDGLKSRDVPCATRMRGSPLRPKCLRCASQMTPRLA